MDDELRGLAEAALLDAFWRDYSALVNAYMVAAYGMNDVGFCARLAEKSNPYGRGRSINADMSPNIYAQNGDSRFNTTGYSNLESALASEHATVVYLNGKRIFERVNGEWTYAE